VDSKAMGFIDATIMCNEDMPLIKWTSAEVVEMLRELRGYLVEDFEPALFDTPLAEPPA
jgi:hypothetical protein